MAVSVAPFRILQAKSTHQIFGPAERFKHGLLRRVTVFDLGIVEQSRLKTPNRFAEILQGPVPVFQSLFKVDFKDLALALEGLSSRPGYVSASMFSQDRPQPL
jgi:hypothetical protein